MWMGSYGNVLMILTSCKIIESIISSSNIGFKNSLSIFNSSYASLSEGGNCLIPNSRLRCGAILKISSSIGSGIDIFFFIPSRPADIIAENAKYGLHDGSGV